MVQNGGLPYQTWVVLGIIGWGLTFLTGNLFLGPNRRRQPRRWRPRADRSSDALQRGPTPARRARGRARARDHRRHGDQADLTGREQVQPPRAANFLTRRSP